MSLLKLKLKERGLVVLLFFVFTACNYWGFSPEAQKGKRTVKFRVAGAGNYEEQPETGAGTRSSGGADGQNLAPEPVSQYLGNGIFVTISAEEDLSALRDDDLHALPTDSKYRILIMKPGGTTEYWDYTVGASDNPPMEYVIPDWERESSYGDYTFIAYSYLNETLPDVHKWEDEGGVHLTYDIFLSVKEESDFRWDFGGGEETLTLPGTDLYYGKAAGVNWSGHVDSEDGAIGSVSLVLRPQFSKATVTLDVSGLGRTIQNVGTVQLSKIASYCLFSPTSGESNPDEGHNLQRNVDLSGWSAVAGESFAAFESAELTFLRPQSSQGLVLPANCLTLNEDETFPSQNFEIMLPDIFHGGRRWKYRAKFSNCGSGGIAATVTDYRDPSTDDDNITYRTHVYGTGADARCWMVDNARGGEFTHWYQDNEESGVVGPYYSWSPENLGWHGFGSACPAGWRVPSVSEYESLALIINKEDPTEDEQKLINLWHGNGFVGWRNGESTWQDQGDNSAWRYWHSNAAAGESDIQLPEGWDGSSLIPVRCVRARGVYGNGNRF